MKEKIDELLDIFNESCNIFTNITNSTLRSMITQKKESEICKVETDKLIQVSEQMTKVMEEIMMESNEKDKKEEKKGPGGHIPDGTGPHGRGEGPGQGKADGSGKEEKEEEDE